MPGSRSSNNDTEHNKSPRESGEDSEDESEILEESPCGRWLKRKEEVSLTNCISWFKVFVYFNTIHRNSIICNNVWQNDLVHSKRSNFKTLYN